MIADRELETWLVIDMSASLDFGTAGVREARPRGGGRGGHLLPQRRWRQPARRAGFQRRPTITRVPARSGREHVHTMLRTIATTPKAPAGVRGDLAATIDALRRPERRRGMAVIISDFLGPINWMRPLRAIAARHEVLAIEVLDPRDVELPDIGDVVLQDAESGRHPRVHHRCAAAGRFRQGRRGSPRRSGPHDSRLRGTGHDAAHRPRLDRRHRPFRRVSPAWGDGGDAR